MATEVMSSYTPSACALCLAYLSVACSASSKLVAPPAAVRTLEGPERYMPARDGFVYEYDVETDTGEKGRVMVQVTRPRPDMAELNIAGKVQRLEMSADAVRHATGGYLLKAPLEVGAQWKGQFGKVRIASISRSIQVPAGQFTDCIETVEEATLPTPKRATSVFCRDVGMVSLRIEGELGDEAGSVGTLLRSYGPRATGFE